MTELPPFLQGETEEVIRDRMLSRLPENLDRSEGSFPWDILSPTAIELTQAGDWANEVLRRVFASTTFGTYLDFRCAEHGVYRRSATKARTAGETIQFRGDPGSPVPAGYIISTESTESAPAILFQTLAAVVLSENGEAFVGAEAIESGRSGNVPVGAIRHLTDPLPGIKSVTNLSVLEGGADVENDDTLRERYFLKVRTPAGSGNKSDYEQWALSVPGVGGVKVIPLWAGPGTVKVVLLDDRKKAASSVIVETVATYINSICPIGATVSVAAAREVPINVMVSVTLTSEVSLQEVQKMIEDRVQTYLKALAFDDPIVRYTRIANIILDIPPIIDYKDLLVNGGQGNIEITEGDVAVLGTVTVQHAT